MKWVKVLLILPLLLWGQTFTGSFRTSFISRSGRKISQKPASTLQISLSGGVNLFGISAGFNIFFNSEDKFTPQATSFYSLTPTWSWGRIYIGNFSPSFSPLTISGMSVQGAGLELYPGIFKLFVISGRIKKASEDTMNLSYERYIWGVRLGLGKNTGTRLTLLNSKDIASSANDSIMREHNIRPQENWVAEVSQKISLFSGKFSIKALGAASFLTRNIYAGPISSSKIPDWVKSNFHVNKSTRADYAYRIESSLRLRSASFQFTHNYIGPGYKSHGIDADISDRIEDGVRFNTSLSAHYGSFGIGYTITRDNLINTQNGTSRTNNANAFLSLILSRSVTFYSSATLTNLKKTSEFSDSLNMTNRTKSVSSGLNFRFGRKVNLSINGGFSEVKTSTVIREIKGNSLNAGVSFRHRLTKSFSYIIGVSTINFKSDTLESKSYSPSLGLNFRGGRLNFTVTGKAGLMKEKTSLSLSASSSVKITKNDIISMRLSSSKYLKGGDAKPTLEFRASYSRNFRFGKKQE